jgi:hypothetical protein
MRYSATKLDFLNRTHQRVIYNTLLYGIAKILKLQTGAV